MAVRQAQQNQMSGLRVMLHEAEQANKVLTQRISLAAQAVKASEEVRELTAAKLERTVEIARILAGLGTTARNLIGRPAKDWADWLKLADELGVTTDGVAQPQSPAKDALAHARECAAEAEIEIINLMVIEPEAFLADVDLCHEPSSWPEYFTADDRKGLTDALADLAAAQKFPE